MLQWTVLRSNIGTSVKNKARARRQSQVTFLAKILPFLQPMLTESAFLESIQTGELVENPVKGCSFKNLGLSTETNYALSRAVQIQNHRRPEQTRVKSTPVPNRPESNHHCSNQTRVKTPAVLNRPEWNPPLFQTDQSQNPRRPE